MEIPDPKFALGQVVKLTAGFAIFSVIGQCWVKDWHGASWQYELRSVDSPSGVRVTAHEPELFPHPQPVKE